MSNAPETPEPQRADPAVAERDVNWTRRLIYLGIGVVAILLAYIVGGAVLPRWWGDQIGNQVGGSPVMGVLVGLFYGITFTFLPLFVLYLGFRRRRSWKVWSAYVLAALILAIPNLLTLGIVVGRGNAAHAGERKLDVEASYFRGATGVGVVLGVLLFAFAVWTIVRHHQLRDRKRSLSAEREALEKARAGHSEDDGA